MHAAINSQGGRWPLMGWGLSLGRNVNLCWQPLVCAMYTRPITPKFNNNGNGIDNDNDDNDDDNNNNNDK